MRKTVDPRLQECKCKISRGKISSRSKTIGDLLNLLTKNLIMPKVGTKDQRSTAAAKSYDMKGGGALTFCSLSFEYNVQSASHKIFIYRKRLNQQDYGICLFHLKLILKSNMALD